MPILVFLIVFSIVFYLYYKVKYVRSRMPMERKLLNGKSSMALGLFVGLFGVNLLFIHQTLATYIVAPLFIIIGFLSAWVGFKTYRHHIPYALQEAEEASK